MSLRVALLTYRGNPFSGGQGVYVRELSRALRDEGHEVTVVSGPPYPELDAGVRLARLPGLDLYSTFPPGEDAWRKIRRPADLAEYVTGSLGVFPEPLAFGLRAWHWLARHGERFDIVHDNQSLSLPLLGVNAWTAPVVATVHHPIHIDRAFAAAAAESRRARTQIGIWYGFSLMQELVAPRLPRLIAVSEQSRRDVIRHLGARPERVVSVLNGVDSERFASSEAVPRRLDRVLVVNSADQEIKGLRYLYPVIEQVVKRRPAEVVVVGAPANGARARAELERRGIAEHVRFLGKLPAEALPAVYASASVAVVPSLYEGFGLPAAEAMASSVPVVAFAAGALPEVIGPDRGAGCLVPLRDVEAMAAAVVELLDDPAEALRMGAAGRQRVTERFTWERAARETAAVYQAAIAERARAR